MKRKVKDLIIGYGQVGRSLQQVFDNRLIYDPPAGIYLEYAWQTKFLHICYPYFKNFIKQTLEYIEEFQPYATIIHSTVPVGTTQQINTHLIRRKQNISVFHSPVRGMHPNLATS